MKSRPGRLLMGLAVLAAAAVGLVFSEAPSDVPWGTLRAVVIESDDWGLPGFVPHAGAWDGLDRASLAPGRFPPVYWESTLEDSAMVSDLCAVLAAHRGRDGLPAVFQPNYVMGSLAAVPDGDRITWRKLTYPDLPAAYRRPGLHRAVSAGQAAGVWYPEFHASLHYDPERRLATALDAAAAAEATRRGIMLFPGSESARELGPWRETADLAAELDASLAAFARAFGRPVGSVIAPDYTWNARVEDLWESRGLTVIQGKREQRNPDLPPGLGGRLIKVWNRAVDRRRHAGRQYLERNCRLEPVQAPDPSATVEQCLRETRAAWDRGQPAIVETHRINFAHTDPAVVRTGQHALGTYLTALVEGDGGGPVFLTDSEVAQLNRRGVSVVHRGQRVILRNATHSARVVHLSPEPAENGIFYILAPGQTLIL